MSRYAHQADVPLVEGWALPIANVRVFTNETITLEEAYNLPTVNTDIEITSAEQRGKLKMQMLMELGKIEGLSDHYSPLAMERINKGTLTSFAPMVWLTAVLMSLETTKIILNKGKIAYAPDFFVYDPYKNCVPKIKE